MGGTKYANYLDQWKPSRRRCGRNGLARPEYRHRAREPHNPHHREPRTFRGSRYFTTSTTSSFHPIISGDQESKWRQIQMPRRVSLSRFKFECFVISKNGGFEWCSPRKLCSSYHVKRSLIWSMAMTFSLGESIQSREIPNSIGKSLVGIFD